MVDFVVNVSWNSPADFNEWNALAETNSNFFQSSYYDSIQNYFKNKPVYFELKQKGKLIAGVKLLFWESNKLGFFTRAISKSLLQHGEIIYDSNLIDSSSLQLCLIELKNAVHKFIIENRIVQYTVQGVYGQDELLLSIKEKIVFEFEFNSGFVDMDNKSAEQLIEGFNRNTKRNLKKTNESQLVFSELNDSKVFNDTMEIIFSQQFPPKPPPYRNYVNSYFTNLEDKKVLSVHQVKFGDNVLAISLFVKNGKTAYSLFGGSIKNEIGAGHYLYYNLMKLFIKEGITKFYFGQVSRELDSGNKKFTQGISGFKRGFGITELRSFKKIFITNKFKYRLWKMMLKIQELKNRK